MDYLGGGGGGGGAKGMLPPPPLKLLGGGGLAPLAPLFLRLCINLNSWDPNPIYETSVVRYFMLLLSLKIENESNSM